MDIEARKIEFIQEFLKIQSEDVISHFEKLLREKNNASDEKRFELMTIEELNRRID